MTIEENIVDLNYPIDEILKNETNKKMLTLVFVWKFTLPFLVEKYEMRKIWPACFILSNMVSSS